MLFLAGNTNKVLCSAATLAVLDALDTITSRCRRPKLLKGSKKRDGGSNGNLNGESAKETMFLDMRVSG